MIEYTMTWWGLALTILVIVVGIISLWIYVLTKYRTLTGYVTASLITALGVYDGIAVGVGHGNVNNSVTNFLVNASSNVWGLKFVFGFVCGHLFANMYQAKKKQCSATINPPQ